MIPRRNKGGIEVKHTDILVKESMQDVKQAVQQIFEQNGFKVEWKEQYSGKATRGSKGLNIALGAFAQHYAIDFQIIPWSDEVTAIRLVKSSTGLWGSAAGVYKTAKQYEKIVDLVSNQFEKVCPECKHISKIGSEFCEQCGSKLLVVAS
jgi:hypothetical protein